MDATLDLLTAWFREHRLEAQSWVQRRSLLRNERIDSGLMSFLMQQNLVAPWYAGKGTALLSPNVKKQFWTPERVAGTVEYFGTTVTDAWHAVQTSDALPGDPVPANDIEKIWQLVCQDLPLLEAVLERRGEALTLLIVRLNREIRKNRTNVGESLTNMKGLRQDKLKKMCGLISVTPAQLLAELQQACSERA